MSCRVCFRSEGRTVSETMFTAGRKIIIPNSPSRPGFEFSGWWVADGGSIREFSRQWLEDRKASEDVVVDARWKNVSYRLEVQEFNTDGYVQDGAISSDLFFKFHSDGSAVVHSMKDHRELGRFILDKADIFKPHCNATCFSAIRFRSEDEFPLLYANIYNSYAKEQDRKLGYFGAYRLFRDGDSFSSELVQVLRIGFTAENGLWHSEDGNDRSPYGNFIVDTDRNEMWAFVTRDLPHSTRFFSFRLPDADEGVFSEDYGVKVFTFGKEDILRMFDIPYSYYLQGACYHKGKIYSTEGLGTEENPSVIRTVDLKTGTEESFADLQHDGYPKEAEFIDVWNGSFWYGSYKKTDTPKAPVFRIEGL